MTRRALFVTIAKSSIMIGAGLGAVSMRHAWTMAPPPTTGGLASIALGTSLEFFFGLGTTSLTTTGATYLLLGEGIAAVGGIEAGIAGTVESIF